MKVIANSGRWIVECPECKSALAVKQFNAAPEFLRFGCVECGCGMAGYKWNLLKGLPVDRRIRLYREFTDCMTLDCEFPPEVAEIEQALLRRKHAAWRNWLPGMTVQELIDAEPGLHFSWTMPRTWAIEIVTASMLNTHLRDNMLETAPAKVTIKGDLLIGSGANSIGRLPIGSNTQALVADSAETLGVKWGAAGSFVVQQVNTQTGTNSSGSTVLPFDNTIPQSSEGDPYMSRAITPLNASNILYVDVLFIGGISTGGGLTVALFKDSDTNALASVGENMNGLEMHPIPLRYRMVAGGVSAITFNVRAGINVAGTCYFNSHDGNPYFNGLLASSITITEVLP